MKFLAALTLAAVTTIDANDWQWVPIEGTKCMNGEETGVHIRKSVSGEKSLGVYLHGGGACFNKESCATTASSHHPGSPGSLGIFDQRSVNPLAKYNWMAVPYCTGDVHGGDATKVLHGKLRGFNGVANLKLMMAYASRTFNDVDTLFITGESAGGFGALTSYATIRDFYPNARGVLVDDSGPVLDDEAIPVCLQQEWRQTWDLNKNLPKDCPCNNDDGNLVSAWSYVPIRYPNDSFSLISSESDATISMFLAFGNAECRTLLPMHYNKLHAGLIRLAKSIPVYIIPGSHHTHTTSSEFFSRVVAGVSLYKWVDQLIDPARPDPKSVQPTSSDGWNELHKQNQTFVV